MRINQFYKNVVLFTVLAMILSWMSISNSSVYADISNLEIADATLLGSKEKVAPGETFSVKYGVSNVKKAVYAQDITFEFDPAVLEYVPGSLQSLLEGVIIVNEPNETTPGKLRVLLASLGSQYPITEDTEIVELSFKAANVGQSTDAVISIIQGTLSNDEGEEANVTPVSLTIQIKVETEVSGDVNGDGKVSVGDLAMIAAKYGMDSSSPDWDKVKHLDIDGSGAIDVADLSIVAKMIVDQE